MRKEHVMHCYPKHWQETTIGGLCEGIFDGPHATPRKTEHGPIFLGISCLANGRLNLTGAAHLSDRDFVKWTKRVTPREGDVVFSYETRIGEAAIIPKGLRCCLGRRMGLLRPNKNSVDPRFLLYAWLSPAFQEAIKSRTVHGSTVDRILLTELSSYPVIVPPLDEQRAIAHILGTLDDKIELNRRMNEALEGMARAIFKSWFVDFDPVHAKAEGRPTGLPPDINALFPDSFQDSELGEIPKMYSEGSLGDLILQRTERVGPREVSVLSAVATGKLARSDEHFTKRVYSKETAKYLLVEQWDFAYNPSRINIGSIGMLEEEIQGGVSPVYVVARPKPVYRWFLEFYLRLPKTKVWINTLASGSVRQSLSYADFASIPCVVPPEEILEVFNRKWIMLREGIQSREEESVPLVALRDTLLSKLISGELCVPDAERIVERSI